MRQPFRADLGHSGYHHTGVGVAHQRHVVQPLVLHKPGHVLNVQVEIDLRRLQQPGQVRPLPQSAQGGRVHHGARPAQQRRNLVPAPAAMPGPMHQYESRHSSPPFDMDVQDIQDFDGILA